MYANNCHSVICPFGFQTLIIQNLCVVFFSANEVANTGLIDIPKTSTQERLKDKNLERTEELEVAIT